ncbi:MAG: MATE family efflux transporter [Muribaculaceae bacterium]|nr:MATE family efflux transporter [Muribaculaceae bacterium]
MENIIEPSAPRGYFSTVKNLLKLGLPVLVTQVGIIVVSFADTMMVGAYGLNELAASAFVNSLFLIGMVMLLGFAGGVTPIIGALYGKGDHEEGGLMLRASLLVNIAMAGIFIMAMGCLYFLLPYFGQDADLMPIAKEYYLIILPSLLPMAIFNCMQQACNGVTDTATPMWIIIGADILNILGNYALIFGNWGCPELGLAGAGWSTLAARTASAIAIIIVYTLSPRYYIYWQNVVRGGSGRDRKLQVWKTSYPLMVQSGVECGLWTVGAVVSGWFGKVELAAYQVMNTIGQLGFMIYMSFGWATSIKVANYTGQKDFSCVRLVTKVGLHMILVLATIASLVFLFFTDKMVNYFTPEEDVVAYAMMMILPLVLYQYCDGTQLTYVNALRGTSEVKPLLWISIVSYIFVGISVLMLFAVGFGMETVGVYYSFSVALLTAAVLLVVTFRRTVRKLESQENNKIVLNMLSNGE